MAVSLVDKSKVSQVPYHQSVYYTLQYCLVQPHHVFHGLSSTTYKCFSQINKTGVRHPLFIKLFSGPPNMRLSSHDSLVSEGSMVFQKNVTSLWFSCCGTHFGCVCVGVSLRGEWMVRKGLLAQSW